MSLREKLAKSLEAQILEAYKAVGSTLEEIVTKLGDEAEHTGEFRPARIGEMIQGRGDGKPFVASVVISTPVLIVHPKPEPTFPVLIYIPVVENGKHISAKDRGLREGEREAQIRTSGWMFFRRLPDRQMTLAHIAELEQAQ